MVELIAAWNPSHPTMSNTISSGQNISQALAPMLLGRYISLLDEQSRSVFRPFGPNYERLLDLKRRYDG